MQARFHFKLKPTIYYFQAKTCRLHCTGICSPVICLSLKWIKLYLQGPWPRFIIKINWFLQLVVQCSFSSYSTSSSGSWRLASSEQGAPTALSAHQALTTSKLLIMASKNKSKSISLVWEHKHTWWMAPQSHTVCTVTSDIMQLLFRGFLTEPQ